MGNSRVLAGSQTEEDQDSPEETTRLHGAPQGRTAGRHLSPKQPAGLTLVELDEQGQVDTEEQGSGTAKAILQDHSGRLLGQVPRLSQCQSGGHSVATAPA